MKLRMKDWRMMGLRRVAEKLTKNPKSKTLRTGSTPVDVDGVGHGLKRVERNAHRQEDLVHAECRSQVFIGPLTKRGMRLTPVRAEQRLQCVRDEVRVLEVQQNAQVDGQTHCEPAFALRTLCAILLANPQSDSRKNEDGHKCATRFPVEKQARQEQVGIAHTHAFFGNRHLPTNSERPERGIQNVMVGTGTQSFSAGR